MRRIWILAATAVLSVGSVIADNERPIAFEQLPHQAKNLITKDFADAKLLHATEEPRALGSEYDVVLDDGTKIEFGHNGEWREIKRRGKAVPSSLVPKKIVSYVNSKYPQGIIIGLERENGGYEVKLNTGIELTFNANLHCVDTDF